MAGAKGFEDVAVVLAPLVRVLNHERNRGAGGFAFVHTAQNLHRIRFIALGHMAAGAGAAAVQVDLNVGLRQRHARGTAVNDAANGRAV